MASACVNNIGMSPESFLDSSPSKYPSYGWLNPRISFSRELADEEASKTAIVKAPAKTVATSDIAVLKTSGKSDPEIPCEAFVDFEFRLEDPVTMLPADELFSDGKLRPLHLSSIQEPMRFVRTSSEIRSPDTPRLSIRNEISLTDPYLFSPKAPRCSSRWKELLGLKKLHQNSNAKSEDQKAASANHNNSKNAARSLKHFLHRSSKSPVNASSDSSLSLPLLKDTDNESISISSRISLSSSSSSSGHEHDDLLRLSLDSDEPITLSSSSQRKTKTLSKVRVARPRALSSEHPNRATRVVRSPMRRAPEPTAQASGVSADSPRMNSSGKVVFNSLERSSSSPSSFNGGPRYKHRGMERSYSANVRITPVLNVPVCSLRGSSKSGVFGLFSSQQKKDSGGGNNGGGNRDNKVIAKNRSD